MKTLLALAAVAVLTFAAAPAGAQVQIESTQPSREKAPEVRIVPPPLHYEQTRPRDNDFYPYGTRVEYDPAFIQPFAKHYANSKGSGWYGLSGWTMPNTPVGPEAMEWRVTSGWFALGFSVTWDGPPVRPAPAQPSR